MDTKLNRLQHARTQAQLGSTLVNTCHVWTHPIYDTRTKFPRMRNCDLSQLQNKRAIYLDITMTANMYSALYTTLIKYGPDCTETETDLPHPGRQLILIGVTHVCYDGPAYIRFLHVNTRQKPIKRLRTNIITYLIIFEIYTNQNTLLHRSIVTQLIDLFQHSI